MTTHDRAAPEIELGLRDRKKVRVRAALVDAATALFLARGFDAVTVDEIAAAADVSRRTFFRYFPTKEAVVFARRDEQLALFRERLAASGDAAPFDALRGALLALADDYMARRTQILQERALTRAAPTLLAGDLEVDRAFESIIAEHLVAHSRRTAADQRRARMTAAAMVGVVRVALDEWADRDGDVDLARLAQDAIELLTPIVPRFR
ncbi:MAG: TetR family transcriptional regulator [Deltaproteobacteria bacterium]|nr:TetR family transcriptional regulator [Deltaproteobacteria bacterium]